MGLRTFSLSAHDDKGAVAFVLADLKQNKTYDPDEMVTLKNEAGSVLLHGEVGDINGRQMER